MEEHIKRSKRVEKRNTALVYIIIIIFVTLGITTYLLHDSMKEVKTLQSHKKVLIDRLGEEVWAKRKLQKRTDSLEKILETSGPIPVSVDLQNFK